MIDNPAHDPRIYFAGERTMLAWIRTGLALMGFGFVVARFGLFLRQWAMLQGTQVPQPGYQPQLSLIIGTTMVAIGIIINAIAAWRHGRFVREFRSGQALSLGHGRIAVGLAWLLAVLGVVIAAYLISIPTR